MAGRSQLLPRWWNQLVSRNFTRIFRSCRPSECEFPFSGLTRFIRKQLFKVNATEIGPVCRQCLEFFHGHVVDDFVNIFWSGTTLTDYFESCFSDHLLPLSPGDGCFPTVFFLDFRF